MTTARVEQVAVRTISQSPAKGRFEQVALRVVSTNVPNDPPVTESKRPIICVIC